MKKIICVLVLLVLLTGCGSKKKDTKVDENKVEQTKIYLKADKYSFSATLVENTTTKKLVRKLKDGDITINMNHDDRYQMVGTLKFGLPTNEQNIKTVPGEIVLYKDNQFIISVEDFFLNLTRIGKLDNPNDENYRELISKEGDIEFTISLNE